MLEPDATARPSSSARLPVLLGLFAGTAVGGGYLLAGVPNVELMTLVVALAGAVLGPWRGYATGAVAAAVYSLGSPYGLPAPPLLAAQVVGLGCAGPLGSLWLRFQTGRWHAGRLQEAIRAAVCGLVGTVIYEVLTNLAILGMLDLPPAVVLAGAVPFFLLHAGSNLVIFSVLFPMLAKRLVPLARSPLVGRSGGSAVIALISFELVCLGTACAQPSWPSGAAGDSIPNPTPDLIAEPGDTIVAGNDSSSVALLSPSPVALDGPRGWRRALWRPFDANFLEWTARWSPWLPFVDGGAAASARLLNEAGTSPMPAITRDGVPLGTGHALADDPWLVGIEGLTASTASEGADGLGGTDGRIELAAADPDPTRAYSSYRGIKGRHESYYRGVDFLTPHADWRVGFTFEETLDNDGYNHTLEPDLDFQERRRDGRTGQGKVRQNRTTLVRSLNADSELAIDVFSGRRTRDDLPALGAGSLEAWNRGATVRMRWRSAAWEVRPAFHWTERDVQWGGRYVGDTPASDLRLLESGREGLRFDFRRLAAAAPVDSATAAGGNRGAPAGGDAPWRFSLAVDGWRLHDTGADTIWAGSQGGPVSGRGEQSRLAAGMTTRVAGARLEVDAGAVWNSVGGLGPDVAGALADSTARLRWRLVASWGGRAPRSDELLTPMRNAVAGRPLVLLPNPVLGRERVARLAADAGARLLGLDLAAVTSVRHLSGGITWRADPEVADRGTWENDLDLSALRLTVRAGREGRFLGWGRAAVEGTWQSFDRIHGQAALLPAESWQRLSLQWENHFFREDGILQLALLTTRIGTRADPWDVTRSLMLPERTMHDLLVGFRLLGADLTLAARNLTGQRQQLTAGAWSPGRELDMRLNWAFPR